MSQGTIRDHNGIRMHIYTSLGQYRMSMRLSISQGTYRLYMSLGHIYMHLYVPRELQQVNMA